MFKKKKYVTVNERDNNNDAKMREYITIKSTKEVRNDAV